MRVGHAERTQTKTLLYLKSAQELSLAAIKRKPFVQYTKHLVVINQLSTKDFASKLQGMMDTAEFTELYFFGLAALASNKTRHIQMQLGNGLFVFMA